jgi:hypothetical protein
MINDPPYFKNDCRADLMAGIIEHLACYIQSGRPRSAHLAALLLDRLAGDAALDDALREHCKSLVDVLIEQPGRPAGACDRAPDLPSRPWLVWERIEEAL